MSTHSTLVCVSLLSGLLASPWAMAEESPAFVARNAALQATHQEAREALTAHPAEGLQGAQQTASKATEQTHGDS
ncbi:hypothetical protein G7007_03000 [Pseudomonas entomophila]|uniref:hypothetical protein n=1 Tax=Pseudomonas entomophila TaxID=312306 RepID=UPI0015E3669C|nr:hypothetical protein [Pseudomonas entomophila]MBA1191832.1 hypothetical protein [Pseudomonas entomophila]